jgi:hypothetical protein
MSKPIGHITLLPTYQTVPACAHAVSGACSGNNCPCPAGSGACAGYSPPDGLPGEGLPQAAVDAYWEDLAATHPAEPLVAVPAPQPAGRA